MQNFLKSQTRLAFIQFIFQSEFSLSDKSQSLEDFQEHFSTEFYLNGIGYEQWIDIISEYFTFSKIEEVYCKDQVGNITFKNCEPKK